MPEKGREVGVQVVPGLRAHTADGVRWLTLDREERYNALTGEMSDALAAQLVGVVADDEVLVVVITGTGAAFSTGADVGAGPDGDPVISRFGEESMERAARVTRAIVRLDQPVVAAVNGIAAGVGCSVALACDLVVAAESASFLLPFARIGLMPDGGATASVAASIGRARSMRMALLAEPLPAADAVAAGLATHVVPDEDFHETVGDLARRLAGGPPLALAASKKAINAATLGDPGSGPGGLDLALQRETRGQVLLFGTSDAAEGMAAFAEKRKPRFTGQ